jgi:hypothetical protein
MLNLKKQTQNTMNRKAHILAIIVAGSAVFGLNGCNAGQSSKGGPSTQQFKPGNLAINPSLSNHLFESQSTTVTIALIPTGGFLVESANVSIVSNNPKVLSVTPSTCALNSLKNTCNVTLTGESVGVANFRINAPSLAGVTSESYIIIAQTLDRLSGDMPYSRDHAGVQTPVKVIFGNPVNESSINPSTFYVTAPNGEHIPGTIVSESENATFIPSSPLAYGKTYTVHTTNGIKDLNGDSVAPLTESNTYTTQELYSIFVSSAAIAGNLNGVDGADNTCATDTKCPTGSICKAMLATSSGATDARQANPVNNWVLEPYTAYVNEAGQLIGTTGIGGAINSSVFAYPLNHAVASSSTNIWTGLDPNWTSSPNTCSDWSVGDNSKFGNVGDASNSGESSLFNAYPTCESTHNLYCVQVPQ